MCGRRGCRPLHAGDGREAGLDHAHQVVGDLVLVERLRREAQVGRRELGVGGLDVDRGHLRLGGQVAADLVDLGADLGEGLDRVVVELEAGRDVETPWALVEER
jgi:hypothetical protein